MECHTVDIRLGRESERQPDTVVDAFEIAFFIIGSQIADNRAPSADQEPAGEVTTILLEMGN